MRRIVAAAAAAVGVGFVISCSASADLPDAGAIGSLTTVRPQLRVATEPRAELIAARNEIESFQVVLWGGTVGLDDATVALDGPLIGPGGARIRGKDVTIYREGLVDLEQPSDVEGAVGEWPDPLIPTRDRFYGERRSAFPIDVPGSQSRAAWIDVHVPAGAPAGDYVGSVSVGAVGFRRSIPVTVQVLDLGLPSTAELDSSFGIDTDLCRFHPGCTGAADEWALHSLYVRAGLENKISISDLAVAPLIGRDRALFRRYMQPLIDGRGTTPAAPRPPLLHGERLRRIQVDMGHFGRWRAEARIGGFRSRTFAYLCDEPGTDAAAWAECLARSSQVSDTWPHLDTLTTASITDAENFGALPAVDLLVVLINELYDKEGVYEGNNRQSYNEWLRSDPDNEAWIYNACPSHGCDEVGGEYFRGWASYVIDQPASEARAMGPLAFSYDVTGELYYRVDGAVEAWSGVGAFGGNGDGSLFYPGRPDLIGGEHDIPIESIRLKRIRDGREDYEWLEYLQDEGLGPRARLLVRNLMPSPFQTAVSQEDYDTFRAQLARLIGEQAAGAGG